MRIQVAVCFLLLFAALVAPSQAAAPAPHRKLLQWAGGSWGTGQRVAAAQVSRTATQQAIRAAVNNPFPQSQFAATRTATNVGQIGTTLTSTDPCSLAWTPGCWGGWGWGYGWPFYGRR